MCRAKSHDGMVHALLGRGDVAAGGVVVGAEMGGDGAAAGGVEEERQVGLAARAEDRLRGLDHELEAQRAAARGRARGSMASKTSARAA